ncbi:cupin domain-containing protein [Candidatus Protochlamydia phocaeensis]|uniref:cupin domain-containing protein n=1 Tax=Candidatus Protochlamydia phocaeensis TaxID=1414722 RepID=UPI000838B000|nr:cupin domain-containing protein [Candidatus Protochlamydia phocaeensis]
MKKVLAILMCSRFFQIQALEYEQQFENDQICIGKATIAPHEEIGLHRDMHPQVVIALKGGTITRLEADGRTTDVKFPTGKAIFRKADPENEQHRSVNNSSEPVELIIIQLKNSQSVNQKVDEESHDIAIDIKINCPMSTELKDFVKSIPPAGNYSSSFEEWKSSFVNNMTNLIRLVESEKISNSFWSVKTDDRLSQEVKDK